MPWRAQTLVVLLPGQGRLCVTGPGRSELARNGIVHQGHGVDHAHTTLFPMHGTAGDQGKNWCEVAPSVEPMLERRLQLAPKIDHSVSYRPVVSPATASQWSIHAQ